MSADRHGWNEYENYIIRLERQVRDFSEAGFVHSSSVGDLTSRSRRDHAPELVFSGRLSCADSLYIDVEETFEVMTRAGRPWIRMVGSKFQAGISGPGPRIIFRYDNAHSYPGHPDAFHKHQFDPATWQQADWPVWIGRAQWPSLGDVLEELRQWWEDTGQFLDLRHLEP